MGILALEPRSRKNNKDIFKGRKGKELPPQLKKENKRNRRKAIMLTFFLKIDKSDKPLVRLRMSM